MKTFGLAIRLWAGTILINAGSAAFIGLFTLSGYGVVFAIIGFFVAAFCTWPLLFPTDLLIRISCKIPYSPGVKLLWLGSMLIFLNYIFFRLLEWISVWIFRGELGVFFYTSTFALIIMLFASRSLIRNFYSQQTTSNKES